MRQQCKWLTKSSKSILKIAISEDVSSASLALVSSTRRWHAVLFDIDLATATHTAIQQNLDCFDLFLELKNSERNAGWLLK